MATSIAELIEAKTRTDWLPGYPAAKILYWLDRHSFYPLRVEQYDQQGELQLVEVRLARLENPALGECGYAALATTDYDPKRNMTSYSFHDAHTLREWTDQDREVVFSPDFMRRGWLVQSLKSQVLVHSPSEAGEPNGAGHGLRRRSARLGGRRCPPRAGTTALGCSSTFARSTQRAEKLGRKTLSPDTAAVSLE